jgi:CHAT domain-containing protein
LIITAKDSEGSKSRMGILSKTLLLIASVAVWAAPSTAFAQFGSRLRQMAAPQQNGTQYAIYEGDLHFEHGVDPVCTALTNGVYKVSFAARSGPNGVEAYMAGPQIMHAYISGSDRNHLSVTFLGDTAPSRTMRLVPWGTGFLGVTQSKTLVSEIYGACTTSGAEFKVSRSNGDAQAAFQSFAQQYQLDVSSEQDLLAARRGNINEALPRLQQAFAQKVKQFSPNHPQMLRYYFYLASAYDEAGLYPYAAYWYQKAATVCQQSFAANDPCNPITLLKLGVSLNNNGDSRDAEANIRQAIQTADRVFGPNAPVSWVGYNSLALVLINTGRFAEVEPIVKQALALGKQERSNVDINVASVKYTSAVLYRQTGQYKLAEDTLRESIALVQKVQGSEGTGTIAPKMGLAMIMNLDGQSAEAEPIARNAMAAALKLLGPERVDHPVLSLARLGVAKIDMELGKSREAEELLRKAIENDKKYLGPNHPNVAVEEMTLAKLLRTTGRERDALILLQDAYRISHLTEIQGIRWRVPAEFMALYASGKIANTVLAVYYGKEAVNELQRLRGDMSHSSSGTLESFSNTAEVKSIYKTLAHLLLDDGRIGEAQQVLALLSVQELDQFSQRSMLADVSQPPASPTSRAQDQRQRPGATAPNISHTDTLVPTQLAFSKSEQDLHQVNGEEIEVGQKLDALRKLQHEQGDDFSPADQKELARLQAKYDGYTSNFLTAESKIAKSSKDPHARADLTHEITNFSTAFQGTLKSMGHGAVVAQYFILDDSVEIILATPNAPPIHKSSPIKAAKLNQMIRDFRRALGDDHHDPVPLARQLYGVLIEPIAGDLEKSNAKTLMLSLHDALRYVPFAALNNGKGYLIETMAVVNTSATALDKLATTPKAGTWSAYGLGVTKAGVTKSGIDYAALTYAGKELDDVKSTLGGKIFLDKDFTKSTLQKGLGFYPVIHIASHFEFTPNSIDNSMLLLGDGDTLTLKQIQVGLDFTGVELLTLSACQTAVGDDKLGADGSEVEGLGSVAQEKGAMAVIATLWPVADESTAMFMNALYKAHQVDHLDKAESLRQAQLALLHAGATQGAPLSGEEQRGLARMQAATSAAGTTRDPHAPFAHPYYWAPFILMGNWL